MSDTSITANRPQMTKEEEMECESSLGLREKHEKLLRIMTVFDAFCREHGIHYSLSDGTLLGAVRHQGFIPWDDDADLLITREEYNKLRNEIRDEKGLYLFRIGCLDRITITDYLDEHLYIDLFIIDKAPSSDRKFRMLKYKCGFLRGWFLNIYQLGNSSHKEKSRKIIEPILYRLARMYVGKRNIFDLYDSMFEEDIEYQQYTEFTSTMDCMSLRFPRETFESGYRDFVFRGRTLMVISKPELFLKEMYGDYMMLPPVEKRHPEHDIDMMNAPKDCIRWYNRTV